MQLQMLYNKLNLAFISKKKFCFVTNTNNNLKFLRLLTSFNLLTTQIYDKKIKVTFSQTVINRQCFFFIQCKLSNPQYWSLQKIKAKTMNTSSIYIFANSYGFFSQNHAIKYNYGGNLIGYIQV